MKEFNLNQLIKNGQISSEYELEQASIADRKLRLLEKEDPKIKVKRKQLRSLIYEFEQNNWADSTKVTEQQIKESEEAESLVEQENIFIQKRKELIKSKLLKYGLNQQEFGWILGYKNKSYISELMNGVNPFSLKDLIIISKLFRIGLNDLIFDFVSIEDKEWQEKQLINYCKKLKNQKAMNFTHNFQILKVS